jgi:hypothetical protein
MNRFTADLESTLSLHRQSNRYTLPLENMSKSLERPKNLHSVQAKSRKLKKWSLKRP